MKLYLKRVGFSLFFKLQLGLDFMELVSNCQLKYINGQFYTNFSFCQCFSSASEYFSVSLGTNQEESDPLSCLFARKVKHHFRRRGLHPHLILRTVFYHFSHFNLILL